MKLVVWASLVAIFALSTLVSLQFYQIANSRAEVASSQQRLNTFFQRNCVSIKSIGAILLTEHTAKLKSSQDFLRNNPSGVGGINRELIQKSILEEQALIVSLTPIALRDCAPKP